MADPVSIADRRGMQIDCGIPHLPTQETYWYRAATANKGPHAFNWSDKPHRLVFDLCRIIEERAAEGFSEYDRGRRDMLNAILSPNPEVARKLHDIRGDEGVEFTNIHGKLSFDLVFWVTAVAEQLGIEPKENADV